MREDFACGITQEFQKSCKNIFTPSELQLLYDFIHYCYENDLELMNKKKVYTTAYG